MLLAPALLAALVTMLVAAKAHGREVRLEREAAGHHEVEFGGTNPDFVERLWARDRVVFWTAFPVALVLAGGAIVARDGPGLALLAAPLVAAIVAFGGAGLRHRTGWRSAPRGSALWWGLTALGSIGTVALLA